MKALFFSIVGCSVLSAAVCLALWRPDPETRSAEDAGQAEALTRLSREVEGLRSGQARLRAELDSIGNRIAELAAATPVQPEAATEASGNDPEGGPNARAGDATAVDGSPDDRPDLEEALETLLDPETGEATKYGVWTRLARSGQIDDAVAFFEERAREHPRDADVQTDLGGAYIQKLLTVSDAEKWQWALKADSSYDRALAIDDHHWDARFSKAVSYSFAPPVFGLQAKAIEQFEILRRQQEEQAPRQEFAGTYLLLGNLYSSQGKTERAGETWRRGLELFPENSELRKRVEESSTTGE